MNKITISSTLAVIFSIGGILFFLKDAPNNGKYVSCLQNVPNENVHLCTDLLDYKLKVEQEKNKHLDNKLKEKNKHLEDKFRSDLFLAEEYRTHFEKCLKWNVDHPKLLSKFDGNHSCALSAQIHLKDFR